MPDGAVISLAAFEFECNDLVILKLFDDLGLDAGTSDKGRTQVDLVTIHDE